MRGGMNAFGYVLANPLKYKDPQGLRSSAGCFGQGNSDAVFACIIQNELGIEANVQKTPTCDEKCGDAFSACETTAGVGSFAVALGCEGLCLIGTGGVGALACGLACLPLDMWGGAVLMKGCYEGNKICLQNCDCKK